MTRKDLELIAETIKELNLTDSKRREVSEAFAQKLNQTNDRFNKERFKDACLRKA